MDSRSHFKFMYRQDVCVILLRNALASGREKAKRVRIGTEKRKWSAARIGLTDRHVRFLPGNGEDDRHQRLHIKRMSLPIQGTGTHPSVPLPMRLPLGALSSRVGFDCIADLAAAGGLSEGFLAAIYLDDTDDTRSWPPAVPGTVGGRVNMSTRCQSTNGGSASDWILD